MNLLPSVYDWKRLFTVNACFFLHNKLNLFLDLHLHPSYNYSIPIVDEHTHIIFIRLLFSRLFVLLFFLFLSICFICFPSFFASAIVKLPSPLPCVCLLPYYRSCTIRFPLSLLSTLPPPSPPPLPPLMFSVVCAAVPLSTPLLFVFSAYSPRFCLLFLFLHFLSLI